MLLEAVARVLDTDGDGQIVEDQGDILWIHQDYSVTPNDKAKNNYTSSYIKNTLIPKINESIDEISEAVDYLFVAITKAGVDIDSDMNEIRNNMKDELKKELEKAKTAIKEWGI